MSSAQAPRVRPLFRLVLAALAAIAGLALGGVGLVGVLDAREEASWPAVQAEIVGVERGTYTYRSEGSRPGTRTGTRIVVTYRYQAGGRTHTSTRYSTDEAHDDFPEGSEAEAAARFAALQRASHVTVHVSPDDPSRAVLAGAELAPAIVVSVLGGVLLLGAALLALSARRRSSGVDEPSLDA